MTRNLEGFAKVSPKYCLRPYQKRVVMELKDSLVRDDRVLLHAPTGSGKTRMAMSFITDYFRQHGPTMVLWLAPSKELVSQAANDFQSAWRWQGDVPAAVIEWHGSGERFSFGTTILRNTMLIGGIQMVVQAVESEQWIKQSLHKRVSLVVFDEAHQSVAPSYRHLIENIMAGGESETQLVGLSATPGRARLEESEELASMFGGKKVGIGEGGNPVHFLQSEGYLARASISLEPFCGSVVPIECNGDYSDDIVMPLGEDDVRNQRIVDMTQDLFRGNHRRVLAFTPSIRSAEICAEKMRNAGYPLSFAVSGATDAAARNHYISTYCTSLEDRPEPQVIFNCNVLTAGFDAPKTSAVVIGRPTKSIVRLQQVMGRALRGPESGGNHESVVRILVDDTFEEFASLAELFCTWDSLWDPDNADTHHEKVQFT